MSESRAPATIKDVAAAAGVSVSAVSHYFHRPAKLSAATRERVAAAVETLDFAPNAAARTLRTGRNSVVGYVAFELASARTPVIATRMAERLGDEGIHLLIATDQARPEREADYIRLFERQRVSGVIVSPLGDVETDLGRLRLKGIPSVLMTRRARDPEQPSVSVDHHAGGALAAGHLLDRGRRRVAFVTDTLEIEQIKERYDGALETLAVAGITDLPVIAAPSRSVDGGIAAGNEILAKVESLDAVFCVNDLVAIGVSHALRGRAQIPEELAIIGYDDIEFASTNAVPLTTVRTPQIELADAAVEMLHALMRGESLPSVQVRFAPQLVVRESS